MSLEDSWQGARGVDHPIQFDEDDPRLAQVRAIALSFPDAYEELMFGRPTFRNGKVFGLYGGGTKGPEKVRYDSSVLFLPDADERKALVEDSRFFVPAYFGPAGWLGLNLDAAEVDWSEVAELLDESFRNTAPKRLVARLDAEGGPASGSGDLPPADGDELPPPLTPAN